MVPSIEATVFDLADAPRWWTGPYRVTQALGVGTRAAAHQGRRSQHGNAEQPGGTRGKRADTRRRSQETRPARPEPHDVGQRVCRPPPTAAGPDRPAGAPVQGGL